MLQFSRQPKPANTAGAVITDDDKSEDKDSTTEREDPSSPVAPVNNRYGQLLDEDEDEDADDHDANASGNRYEEDDDESLPKVPPVHQGNHHERAAVTRDDALANTIQLLKNYPAIIQQAQPDVNEIPPAPLWQEYIHMSPKNRLRWVLQHGFARLFGQIATERAWVKPEEKQNITPISSGDQLYLYALAFRDYISAKFGARHAEVTLVNTYIQQLGNAKTDSNKELYYGMLVSQIQISQRNLKRTQDQAHRYRLGKLFHRNTPRCFEQIATEITIEPSAGSRQFQRPPQNAHLLVS